MGIQKELVIDLVLTFQVERNSHSLGRALWAGLVEVGRYFTPNVESGRLEVPLPTRSGGQAIVLPRFRRWYVSSDPPPFDLDGGGGEARFVEMSQWRANEVWDGSRLRRTQHDHAALGASISACITDITGVELGSVIIVVDREIVPPTEWRYVLWNSFPGGTVISTAPMDPNYWGTPLPDDHPERKLEMKQGVRASALCVTGTRIGLSRCENPNCFMFAAVDSVSRLPEMRQLGPEHTVVGLDRGAFPLSEVDPDQVTAPTMTESAS